MRLRVLRKTGVRAPFLPGPLLSANTDPLRSVLVIGALAPALILGGRTQWIGQAARPEDPNWPARPAIVRTVPPPIPGGSAIFIGFPHLEPPERGPSSQVAVGAQPIPSAAALFVGYPHVEPAERGVAPAVNLGQQPVPGAVSAPVGYPHQEPFERGSAPLLRLNQPPIPGAAATLLRAPRDDVAPPVEERVWPAQIGRAPDIPPSGRVQLLGWPHPEPAERGNPSQVDVGQQPIPGAVYTLLGWARLEPTERGGPPQVDVGQQPLPAAAVLLLRAPRDEAVAPPSDRLAPTWVSRPPGLPPGGQFALLGWPRLEAAERGVGPHSDVGQQPLPDARYQLLAPPRPTPLERLPLGASVAVGEQPIPGARATWLRAGPEPSLTRVPGPAAVSGPPTPLVPAIAYLAGHPFDGTITIFGRVRVAWGSARPGATLTGRTPGATITSRRPAVTIEDE